MGFIKSLVPNVVRNGLNASKDWVNNIVDPALDPNNLVFNIIDSNNERRSIKFPDIAAWQKTYKAFEDKQKFELSFLESLLSFFTFGVYGYYLLNKFISKTEKAVSDWLVEHASPIQKLFPHLVESQKALNAFRDTYPPFKFTFFQSVVSFFTFGGYGWYLLNQYEKKKQEDETEWLIRNPSASKQKNTLLAEAYFGGISFSGIADVKSDLYLIDSSHACIKVEKGELQITPAMSTNSASQIMNKPK